MSSEHVKNPPPPPGFKLRHTLVGHHDRVITCFAWSPDGRTLATCATNDLIYLWDTSALLSPGVTTEQPQQPFGTLRRTLKGHLNWVSSIAWSPDGRTLASGSYDHSVRLWDAETSELLHVFEGHKDMVSSLAWSPNGRWFASGSNDQTIRLWFCATGSDSGLRPMLPRRDFGLRQVFSEHSGSVNSVAWSPDGRWLASGSDDRSVRLWDVVVGTLYGSLSKHSGGIGVVAWSPDGRWLASGSGDRTIRIWESKDALWQQVVLEGHTHMLTALSFSPDGRILASKAKGGTICLWRCDTWEQIATLSDPSDTESYLHGLSFHPTAPLLATRSQKDKLIHIWELDFDLLLNAAAAVSSVYYTTAKIALVGDSGVGKTGLGWRLAHGEFKEHPSTHGQQFWLLKELGTTRADGTECEAVLWDLAGQPDYRLVHALFLDDVDLALVLFDPTNRQEPLKGVEYWLRQLPRQQDRPTRAVLIGARADRGTPTLSQQELAEFCQRHGVVGGYAGTSALSGEGLAALAAKLKALIAWDAMPATVTTTTFKRIKDYVLGLKEDAARKGVLVNPAELRRRLQATVADWKFGDDEMMTAVGHLANHGYVTVLRGSSGAETILLVPDVLANLAASLILEARRNPKGLGALDEARVLQGGYEFPELNGLDTHEQAVLLDAVTVLFLGHNLCFRETLGTQTFLVFPALINQKRPILEDIKVADDVSYRINGAVENVYAALVVLLGYTNTFTRTNQWQNQAQYETGRGDVCGFRQIEEREGELELVLYFSPQTLAATRLLFQGLFEQFLSGRDVTVTKYPPVLCPKCQYPQPRNEIVSRIQDGKGFHFCSECGKKITLPKTGAAVTLSRRHQAQLRQQHAVAERRTEYEAALTHVKSMVDRRAGRAAPTCFISYAWGVAEHERWVLTLAKDLRNAGINVILDRWHNLPGASITKFIERIAASDFVAVVGTPRLREKYETETDDPVVDAELRLINTKLRKRTKDREKVLPLLLAGTMPLSFPPLFEDSIYVDFLRAEAYFEHLFDLILTLYEIRFDDPAVMDLRESLRIVKTGMK